MTNTWDINGISIPFYPIFVLWDTSMGCETLKAFWENSVEQETCVEHWDGMRSHV
jgi:hypothetical protein